VTNVLKGITIKPIKRLNDERGFFAEVFRQDWQDLLNEERPAQANFSSTYPSVIRAWHRHLKGQTDYFVVVNGELKICAYEEKTKELNEIVSTGRDLQIVRVPGHYWHGFKVIGNETASLLYFTTRLYDYEHPDEERRPWNDATIIPGIINGSKKDPRVGMPWDWNYPPYK
jgi:dTDP-4-dehydrorhamnose 3,5-epimerase